MYLLACKRSFCYTADTVFFLLTDRSFAIEQNLIPILPLIEATLEQLGALIITDSSCRIVYVNDAYAKIMGFRKPYPIGAYMQDVVPGAGLPKVLLTGKNEYGVFYITPQGDAILSNRIVLEKDGTVIGSMSNSTLSSHYGYDDVIAKLKSLLKNLSNVSEAKSKEYQARYTVDSIVTNSPQMLALKALIVKVAQTKSTVLITGESGTGKELVAQSIHAESRRKNARFIRLNCAAIPENLMESELFGYESGAFTGASKQGHIGKFELADQGTLMLDEINLLSLPLQAKLLRAIQEREIERVGGVAPIKVDVRLICTTNQDLAQMVEQGTFRRDLYYRVNIVSLRIPPLRERREDIPLLVHHFIRKFCDDMEMNIDGVTPEAMALLQQYDWPGNIRELENCIERAFNYAVSGTLDTGHFSGLTAAGSGSPAAAEKALSPYEKARQDAGRQAMEHALAACGGNRSRAVRLPGMDRTSFYKKLHQYGLADCPRTPGAERRSDR